LIVTLGAEGAWIFTHASEEFIPAMPVTVLDTTGAGDCFTGVLAAGIALGQVLPVAARRASRAASIAVTRLGAAASMPRVQELTASDSH
jgi:ribokinase